MWAAPGPTSPGSSGWLDNKAPPPDCWARQLEPGSACRDTLSCPWEGGGEGAGPRETPGTAREALGGGERKRQGCAAHVSVPQFHPEMLARRLRDGAAGRAGGGGSRRDLGTQLPHPARSTCPPRGAVWDGDVAHRPRGMHGGDVRGSGAPMVHGGERCCAVGTVPQSVPAGGVRCARGGGGTEEGRGPRPGLQSQQCPVFPRRGRTCLPPAAARLECGVGAPTWGLQPPPSHRDVSEAPEGSRSFLPSFLFLAPLLGPCLCPCHIFHAVMGEEEALNGNGVG